MCSESTSVTLNHFMKSPLVSWAKTFQDEEKKNLEFKCLCDGVFLYNIWLEIDPHPPYHGISSSANDIATRIRNLDVLVHNIKAFYEEVLGQLLLIKTPDILTLAKNGEEYACVGEMETLLLLILGSAVQCERKEHFIEIIKSMDLEVQHKIVDYIQQITDNPEAVWTTEWNELSLIPVEDQEHMYTLLVQHLRRLVRERDELAQKVVNTALQNINLSSGNHPSSPSSTSQVDKSHLIVELADVKARLRKLQQEVEEKNEGITELKEELEISKDAHSKLRQENLELIQDARTAKTYRDEIDILKERVRKVDRLESELQRYKDKMNELEFYKSRVEELREDNRILVETKTMLEEQLEVSRKRADQVVELEAEILKYCSQINELTIEREADRDRIQQLLEENAQLHIDRKASVEELAQLQSELSQTLRHYSPVENHSLMEQLNTDAQTRVFQLELENQRLRILVDSLNRSPSFEVMDSDGMQDMQKYMDNLDHKLLMDKGNGNLENVTSMWKEYKLLQDKNHSLEKELDEMKTALKKSSLFESQCQELEKLVEELKQNISAQKVELSKCEQLEHSVVSLTAENQRLQRNVESGQQKIDELQQDLQSVESENQKLSNNMESMKLSIKKYHDLERETTNLETVNHRLEQEMKGLEKENKRLKNSLEAKDAAVENFFCRTSCLERENKELLKEVENLREIASKMRELERENKELSQQTAVDKKSLEALRMDLVSEKIANQKLNSEIHKVRQLQENTEALYDAAKHDLESEMKDSEKLITAEANRLLKEPLSHDLARETTVQVSEEIPCLQSPCDKTLPEDKRCDQGTEKETSIAELMEELNKLKLDVQKLEKKNVLMEEENQNLCNQASSLKDQNSNLKSQVDSLQQDLTAMLSQNSSLQSRLAKLEVEITLVTSQNQTLSSQNSLLQTQVSNLEEQNKKACQDYEDLRAKNECLLNDHESLQHLHQQLTNDYESLVKNHSSLKSIHKNLRVEHNSLKVEKLQAALFSQEEVLRLKEVLEEDSSRSENRFPVNLRNECTQLREQLKNLKETHEAVTEELKSLQAMHKSLKTENNELKLKYTAMQGELLECQNETSSLDIEVSKLRSCCDLLSQKNTLLEEEQQSLMSHVSVLLGQYHELLLLVSEHGKFRKEESSFREKLWELCQQKEKLEQRISDHCHKLQRSPKRKHNSLNGSLRMRRTRSAFLRNAKHNDPLSFHSDNSTDSSLYCSFRRPKKSSGWNQLNRASLTNPEDSCQEDHIPVRDVGLGGSKEGNKGSRSSIMPSLETEKNTANSTFNSGPRHTTLENNMTVNLITNLTNATEHSAESVPHCHNHVPPMQQVPPYQPRTEYCFQSLPNQGSKTATSGFQSISRISQNSDSSSNPDLSDASRYIKTRPGDKNMDHSMHNNAVGSEKCSENSIWYEYGCV